MVRKFLQTANYRVSEAENAQAAFALVKSDPPDRFCLT